MGGEQHIQFLNSPCCFFFPCGNTPSENGDLIFCLSLSASSSSSYLSSSSSSSASLWWGLECWETEGDGGTDEGLGNLKPSVWQREKQIAYKLSQCSSIACVQQFKAVSATKQIMDNGHKLDLLCTPKVNSLEYRSLKYCSARKCLSISDL